MIANNAETHVLQRAFRNIMNALARPGRLGVVEVLRAGDEEENPLPIYFETVVKTLVDQAVTFAVSGSKETQATQWVMLNTHSHPTELEQADFVLIPDVAHSFACRDAVLKAFEGTLIAPEKGATILVNCGLLAGDSIPGFSACDNTADTVANTGSDKVRNIPNPDEKLYRVVVSGPGIKDTHTFFVDRNDWIEARHDRGDEHPCGIDFILVDVEGRVVGIPRTTKIVSVEKEGAAWDM